MNHDDHVTISDPEKHQELTAAAQPRELCNGATATIGLTFIRGSSGVDAFSKLSRYETAIERSYYRAFHELQRLQHQRLGGHVPPPLPRARSGTRPLLGAGTATIFHGALTFALTPGPRAGATNSDRLEPDG